MVKVYYHDQCYEVTEGASVLETLEQNGLEVASSCRAGVCQTCLKKLIKGQAPQNSQEGLTLSQITLGYFKPCVSYITEDLVMTDIDAEQRYDAKVLSVNLQNAEIAEIQLRLPSDFNYRPGQYIKLFKSESLVRNYSLASVPSLNEPLSLQVKKFDNGKVSPWLHELKTDEVLKISGPFGTCFYQVDDMSRPLLLIGTGSGLSPLYGILREALSKGHSGQIYLFHGVEYSKQLYKVDELMNLAAQHPQFHYVPCLSAESHAQYESGMVLDVVFKKITSTKGYYVYLSGHPLMVKAGSKKAFLLGANMQDIFADPFA